MSRLSALKKLATGAGLVGASSLLSQEEANAAGIATIMKKLGVAKEVAQEVKAMAKNVPPDVFEQNIKAIQKVSQFKKDPFSMKKLGSGISAEAYDAGDKVVKIPRLGKASVSWNAERNKIIPSIMEEQGFGPKTKTIETSKTNYQVQDKLTPLEDLSEKHPILQNDEILNKLKDEQLLAQYGDGQKKLTKDDYDKLSNLRRKIYDREKELLQNIEKTIPEEMRSLASDKVEDYLKNQMQPPLNDIVEIRDLHSGNIGIDPSNKIKAFDTGNFMNLQKENMTPAMRKKVIENYIASPDKKSSMVESLNQSSKASPTPLERLKAQTDVKKAAAVAPIAMGGELGQEEQTAPEEQPPIPEKTMLDKAKEIAIGALAKGVDAYESLPEGVRSGISRGLTEISRPSAALMGGIYSAQKGENPLTGFVEGASNPDEAPTGEDIVENLNIPDEYVGTKTALATGADLLYDPLNMLGVGAGSKAAAKAAKLKALGKLK